MSKIQIFNAYFPESLKTADYLFEPVDDFSERYKEWSGKRTYNRQSESFVSAIQVAQTVDASVYYPKQPKIWDYCAILSLFQDRNVFPAGGSIFFRDGKSHSWPILKFNEVRTNLESSVATLRAMGPKRRKVLVRTLQLLFEAEHYTDFEDLKDVWFLQAMELFVRGLYCLDNNISDWRSLDGARLQYYDILRDCIDRKGYDTYIHRTHPRTNINPFLQDIATVRNWVMHGKVWEDRVYQRYGTEFTFYYRMRSLLKTVLLDELGIGSFENRDALLHGIAYGHSVSPIWSRDRL